MFESFDLYVYNFDWFLNEVQFMVDLDFVNWYDKCIIEDTLPMIGHMEYIMHVIDLLGNLSRYATIPIHLRFSKGHM